MDRMRVKVKLVLQLECSFLIKTIRPEKWSKVKSLWFVQKSLNIRWLVISLNMSYFTTHLFITHSKSITKTSLIINDKQFRKLNLRKIKIKKKLNEIKLIVSNIWKSNGRHVSVFWLFCHSFVARAPKPRFLTFLWNIHYFSIDLQLSPTIESFELFN